MQSVKKISGILGGIVLAACLTAGSAMAGNLVLVADVAGGGMLYVTAAELQSAQAKHVKHAKIDCPCLEDMLCEGMPAAAEKPVVKKHDAVAMADNTGLGDVY